MSEEESPYGDEIQAALYDILGKITPFVKTEAQGRKFDLVAYIPNTTHQVEGISRKKSKRPTDTLCYSRFRKNYCRRKLDKILMDCKSGNKARHKLDHIGMYEYNGKHYGYDGIWSAVKKACLCDSDACPTFKKDLKFRRRMWRQAEADLGIREGLHTFEVKSDFDTHDRLQEQIPRGLRVADYAWLVIGQSQTIPEWIPPYVGILRYTNKNHSFILVRKPHNLNESFTFYRHVLGSEGFSSKNSELEGTFMSATTFKTLLRKWFINSIFYWDHECAIIDMTDELDHLAKTAHWVKTKREEKIDPKTIQKKLLTNEYLEELS